jgi:diadenosine tetraphosphate (Ap4A) HIT family hydrolase
MLNKDQKYDRNNVFAKIIRNEIPAKKIYEDDLVLAFEDISAVAPCHILIIPKGEYTDFSDFVSKASESEISYFFRKISEIASLLEIQDSGFRIITNKGNDAHQTVAHFHIHMLAKKPLGPLLASDSKLR